MSSSHFLTGKVKIRQLDGAEICAESGCLLGNVVGQELAIHALEGAVHADLDVEILFVDAGRLLLALSLALLLGGPVGIPGRIPRLALLGLQLASHDF